jgi:hypothetical protein
MITQEAIEEKAVDYLTVTGRNPRFVLLDKQSYIDLNMGFFAKERFGDGANPTSQELNDEAVRKNHSWVKEMHVETFHLDILSVDWHETLFEVVG